MPESIFLQEQRRSRPLSERDTQALVARRRLIDTLPAVKSAGPRFASTCYVWPTASCSVGCSHCNFAAPPHSRGLDRWRLADDRDRAIDFVNQMGLWKAVLSGGGEPMDEPEFCHHFIANVESPELEEIELITSGGFAASQTAADNIVEQMTASWRSRSGCLSAPSFTIRLSVDWFHARRLGVEPAARIIRSLQRLGASAPRCYIRSVLLERDTTMAELADAVGGTLTELFDYRQEIRFADQEPILVYYKNLIFDGRMNRRKLGGLSVSIAEDARAETFGQRFRNDRGRHVPARTYNGPTVRHLDGLATVLEDDGGIKILEGHHPERFPTLSRVDSWDAALSELYQDPLTVFLVAEGPEALAELIGTRRPDLVRSAFETNQLYYLTDRLLVEPAVALWATLRIAEILGLGDVAGAGAALSRGWRDWRNLGDRS